MTWQTLLLSAEGRIGRKDFWTGVLVLFLASLLTPVLHVLAPLLWAALLYPWICVFSKRLHDFGKSGWLIVIPFAVAFVAFILALVFGGMGVIAAIFASAENSAQSPTWPAMFGAFGLMLAFLGVAGLVKAIFILWVGLSPGDPAANRFGPPPSKPAPSPA